MTNVLYLRQTKRGEDRPMAWSFLSWGAIWVSCPDCGTAKVIEKHSKEITFFCVHCGDNKSVVLSELNPEAFND